MTTFSAPRRGVTLIELLVTLAIIGIMTSVVTLAVRRIERPSPADPATVIADTLQSVLATGRAATLQFQVGGHRAVATIHPDGTVIADSALAIDRFTGRRQ